MSYQKKEEKKGPKAIASANNWRANFLENILQQMHYVYLRTEQVKILKRYSHSAGLFNFFITLPIKKLQVEVGKKSNRPAL